MYTIIASVISSISSLIVALVSVYLSNRLIAYKVDQLEVKVEKHNGIVEDIAVLKHDMGTVWMRYDDLKERITNIESR